MAAIDGRDGDTKRENEGDEEGDMGRAAKDGRDGNKRRREERGRKGDGKRVAKGEQKKQKKGCKGRLYALDLCNLVGMTRFERATSRPPDVYSTN